MHGLQAALDIAERGVTLIASAHANDLAQLVRNSTLHALVGGIEDIPIVREEPMELEESIEEPMARELENIGGALYGLQGSSPVTLVRRFTGALTIVTTVRLGDCSSLALGRGTGCHERRLRGSQARRNIHVTIGRPRACQVLLSRLSPSTRMRCTSLRRSTYSRSGPRA